MEAKRILIVDDEVSIRQLLRENLQSHGFLIGEAEDGQTALAVAAAFHPNLIVLDLGLPDLDGMEVLKRLREWTRIPILILTVSDDEATKVALLDAGADDYLTKPFGIPELLARVRVALRHHGALEATPLFSSGSLSIDLNSKSVLKAGKAIKLSATEYHILSLLVRSQGRIVSQSQLLTTVWGPLSVDQSHYLRIYIAQLRKKIEDDPSSPTHILNEPGVGYKIV